MILAILMFETSIRIYAAISYRRDRIAFIFDTLWNLFYIRFMPIETFLLLLYLQLIKWQMITKRPFCNIEMNADIYDQNNEEVGEFVEKHKFYSNCYIAITFVLSIIFRLVIQLTKKSLNF